MTHKPIHIGSLSLCFPHKTCFENFTATIIPGSRIAIVGRNGCGKSTLLKILHGAFEAGDIQFPDDATFGYVPQIVEEFGSLSGGQRLNKAVTHALSLDPSILLLDEPTNHLDTHNRKSLMRMLRSYAGTLIVVSHDTELLREVASTIWHIDAGKIHAFSGNYDDYRQEKEAQRESMERELLRVARQEKNMHHDLMREQQRAAKSRKKGEKSIDQHKWPTIVSKTKARRAEETSGRKKAAIDHRKQDLHERLADLRLPEAIVASFSILPEDIGDRMLVSVREGSAGYQGQEKVLSGLYLSLSSRERIAVTGRNGCGKSTLIRAILNDPLVLKDGEWHVPKRNDIGYLDQHYNTFAPEKSVFDTIAGIAPDWPASGIRRHLNDFLFRKNEEVQAFTRQLSGGEKARLSLACIAAKTPRLLILDEITNNLDLETREHVIQVLRHYPGSMIVISHEDDFLKEIGVEDKYQIGDGRLRQAG